MDKLIINAEYNLQNENGYLQVGINDGENKAIVNEDGSLRIDSFTTFQFLNDVFKELKKMNLHLAMMTDVYIENKDII